MKVIMLDEERTARESWKKKRCKIFIKYKFKCNNCNNQFPQNDLILDHKKPVVLGGQEIDSNYQPLCKDCNKPKTNKDIKIISILKKVGLLEKLGNNIIVVYKPEEVEPTRRNYCRSELNNLFNEFIDYDSITKTIPFT